MDVHTENIKSDGSLDKLMLIIFFIGNLKTKEIIVYTWVTTESMRNLGYLLAYAAKHKTRVHQFDFIGVFIQANFKHKVFVKLENRYGEYFPDYANYFGITLRLNKWKYGMTNSGKLFADELTNWLIDETGIKQSKCQTYVY